MLDDGEAHDAAPLSWEAPEGVERFTVFGSVKLTSCTAVGGSDDPYDELPALCGLPEHEIDLGGTSGEKRWVDGRVSVEQAQLGAADELMMIAVSVSCVDADGALEPIDAEAWLKRVEGRHRVCELVGELVVPTLRATHAEESMRRVLHRLGPGPARRTCRW